MHFPETYFVTLRTDMDHSCGGNSPLGWPVPFTDDVGGRKRVDSAREWAQVWTYDETKKKNVKVYGKEIKITNVPTKGFKIVDDIKRVRDHFGSGRSLFRVEDPRGFEFEITTGNLMEIIQATDLIKGEIQGECLYARSGTKNALILAGSEEYAAVKKTTDLKTAAAKFSLRDVSPGDVVMLEEGIEAVYFGKIFIKVEIEEAVKNPKYNSWTRGEPRYNYVWATSVKERYVFCRKDSVFQYDLVSTPKIASLIRKSTAGPATVEENLAAIMKVPDIIKRSFGYKTARMVEWSRKKLKV